MHMTFNIGYSKIVPNSDIPEFMWITEYFFIDIDFTPLKRARELNKWFPFGTCAVIGFPGAKPPWKYYMHFAWHAWSGEPDVMEVHFREKNWHHQFGEDRFLYSQSYPVQRVAGCG
jgi:hypothetical protein